VTRGAGVVDERAAPLGISQVPSGRYEEALSALLGEWSDERAPRLACGMIGSRKAGSRPPYVACPASIDALGRRHCRRPDVEAFHRARLNTRDRHGTPT
jgi:2-dehydro-3-deoxygalactonokinase